LRDIFAGTRAGIDQAACSQLLPGIEIVRSAFALGVWAEWAATIRAFAPGDSQPAQVFDHGLHKLGTATLGIQVFVAEDELSALLSAALGCNPECAGVSEMEKTGGRWGEASAIGN
jgi:hypothetical protein